MRVSNNSAINSGFEDKPFAQLLMRTLESIRDLNYVSPAMEKFLAEFPQHKKLKQPILKKCEIVCTACAVVASAIGSGCDELEDLICPETVQSIDPPTDCQGGRDGSFCAATTTIIGIFAYVFRKTRMRNRDAHLSALRSLSYAAALMIFKRPDFDNHLLHEFISPLLRATYDHFLQNPVFSAASHRLETVASHNRNKR